MGLVLTWPVGREGQHASAAPLAPVVSYLAAATVSGAVVAAAVGGAGGMLAAWMPLDVLVAAIVIVAAALQWSGRLAPLPERRVQVPRRWLLWPSRTRAAAAFGLVIGSGFLTHLKHASAYALAALVLIAPTVGAAAATGAVYGLSRGLILTTTWVADRRLAQRPKWPGLGPSSPTLNHTLALSAVTTLVAGLLALS